MFIFAFFNILSFSIPGEDESTIPPEDPASTATPSSPIPQNQTLEEGVTYLFIQLPDDITSQGLFIAMIVLLIVAIIGIIITVTYFCVKQKHQSHIGAVDFEMGNIPDQTKNEPQSGVQSTRVRTAGTGTRGTRTTRTVSGRPMSASTMHAKSIYAVNTVIL